jgi:hypothetical protein
MEIAPGLIGEVEIVVQPPDSADAHGNKGVRPVAPRPLRVPPSMRVGASGSRGRRWAAPG